MINAEAELFLAIAKEIIHNQKHKTFELINRADIDWRKFKDIAGRHELHSFIYLVLKEYSSFVPSDLMEFFKGNYYRSLIASQYLWSEFLRIFDTFKEKGISLLPIKGISFLTDIYAAFPSRIMTDIDILVKEVDLSAAKEVFFGLGYSQRLDGLKEEYWLKKQCHLEFLKKQSKNTFFADVHFGLDFKRKDRNILPQLWNRTREVDIDGRKIKLLSPEDALFSLALHQRRFGNTLGLKNIFDLALFLKKYGHNFDWSYIVKEAKQGKMRLAVFFILLQTEMFFDVKIPVSLWKDLNVPFYKRRFIKKFIENNTLSPAAVKKLYLKAHFFLFDSLWEPIEYILNIPQEQFAKFYGLVPYDKKTVIFYKFRLFYIPLKSIVACLRKTLT